MTIRYQIKYFNGRYYPEREGETWLTKRKKWYPLTCFDGYHSCTKFEHAINTIQWDIEKQRKELTNQLYNDSVCYELSVEITPKELPDVTT